MSKLPQDPFADLIDDFDGGQPTPVADGAPPQRDDVDEGANSFAPPAPGATYRETCRKCNGRGRFVGYSGRSFGDCFACQGVGYKTYKTSPDERAKGRDQRHAADARKTASIAAQAAAFRLANPDFHRRHTGQCDD